MKSWHDCHLLLTYLLLICCTVQQTTTSVPYNNSTARQQLETSYKALDTVDAADTVDSGHQQRRQRSTHNTVDSTLVGDGRTFGQNVVALLVNYTTRLRKGQPFDICSSFAGVNKALTASTDKKRNTEVNWQTQSTVNTSSDLHSVVRLIRCACHDHNESCESDLACYERELSGPLFQQCDDKLSFNVHQHTQQLCSFLQDATRCKMALMTSSCGVDVADFSRHVTSLLSTVNSTFRARIMRPPPGCDVTTLPLDNYAGFRYDANCPSYFVDDLELCAVRHIYSYHVRFNRDYDLIAMPFDTHSITRSCSVYREYKLCVRPIKKACPRGVRLVDEQNTSTRIYRLKMDFICSKTNRHIYRRHLPCYQTVLASRMTSSVLRPCELLWQQRLKPALRHLTAYRFYCDVTSQKTLAVYSLVEELQQCYVNVFAGTRSRDAGELIGRLIETVFTDPHYLRFRYRPDCQLHRGTPHRSVASTLRQSTPWLRHVKPTVIVPVPSSSQHGTVRSRTDFTSCGSAKHLSTLTVAWSKLLFIVIVKLKCS